MTLIKCPECGKEISDTIKKCINCGYKITKKKILYKEKAKEEKQSAETKKSNNKIIVRLIACFVLLVLMFATYIIVDKSSTEDSKEQSITGTYNVFYEGHFHIYDQIILNDYGLCSVENGEIPVKNCNYVYNDDKLVITYVWVFLGEEEVCTDTYKIDGNKLIEIESHNDSIFIKQE